MGCRDLVIGALLLSLPAVAGCQRTVVSPEPTVTPPAQTPSIGSASEQKPESPVSIIPEEWRTDGSREWRYIVIHHTATNRGSVESIHETHLRRKDRNGNPWMGIGYHFVIGNGNGMEDGAVEPTFRWREQLHGAHAGDNEYNQHGIGIALVGNFEEVPPSANQLDAVKQLVAFLTNEYNIPADRIVGHDEVKTTACPGQYFPLAEVRQSTSTASLNRSEQNTTQQIAGIKTGRHSRVKAIP
jgi:N-acetyl-anhydromuramyl-L-alanine amidase AmpD